MSAPKVLVFCSLFPSAAAPTAGTFIRERAFRVARRVPMVVVAPQPWSPFDALVRRFRRSFRPRAVAFEVMDGVPVHRPRYFSLPGMLKRLDGWLMARGAWPVVRRVAREFGPTLIDAHFLYPDGYAASRLAARLRVPLVVTIRGSKDAWLLGTDREPLLRETVAAARQVISVSTQLQREVAARLGASASRSLVVGNGVDVERFGPESRAQARRRLGIAEHGKLVLSVGNLVAGKGHQRLIALLPALRRHHPGAMLAIVGGGATHGDMREALEQQAASLGVADAVRFFGAQAQDELRWFYSAADVFALATQYEGWANVLLEAMACGTPVVTTDVGGNREVLGAAPGSTIVPFWDEEAFTHALAAALAADCDRASLVQYARTHAWSRRVDQLLEVFERLAAADATGTG